MYMMKPSPPTEVCVPPNVLRRALPAEAQHCVQALSYFTASDLRQIKHLLGNCGPYIIEKLNKSAHCFLTHMPSMFV